MKKALGTFATIIAVTILIGAFITAMSSTAGETKRDGRFIAYDDGTVLDTKTNLMWAAKDNGSDINWTKAKFYCEKYRGGGHTDWRMPTQNELAELYDKNKSRPVACERTAFIHLTTELIDITCFRLWTSDTSGSAAAYFYFDIGTQDWQRQSNDYYARALPVRSVKVAEKK